MEFFRPAEARKFKFVSGSEMRSLGASGAEPPKGFMSPAGWKVLKAYYQGKKVVVTAVEEKKAPVAVAAVAPKFEASCKQSIENLRILTEDIFYEITCIILRTHLVN
jgi:hypothetical protein